VIILLVDNLMFVQGDDIHQIDLFDMMHIVLQNRDYKHPIEARIKEIKIYESIFKYTCLRDNFVGIRSNVCSGR
jgi:hypothetical protein